MENIIEIEILQNIGFIKTYYLMDQEQLEYFENWFNELDMIILDSSLIISKDTIKYNIIQETDEKFHDVNNFINSCGRPFELLEQIDEFNDLFNNIDDANSTESSDIYQETETINNIIDAHIKGDITKVKNLLKNMENCDDDIITNIKKKYT
jgi:hypothetical protein